MVEEKPARNRQSTAARARRHRRKRAGITALGAAVLLLAVVGVGALLYFAVGTGVKYVKDYIGPEENTSFFEQYIEPVVVQDPQPFEKISKANPDWTLMTAIWAALSADENSGRFAYTEDNREILPVTDIETYYVRYFGDDIPPKYHTFLYKGATLEYDEKDSCFYVPLIALDNVYEPDITKVERTGGTVKLTVDFIPGDGWTQDKKGNLIKPQAAKTMYFILSGSRGKYIIKSIESGKTASGSSSAAGNSAGVSQGAGSSSAAESSSAASSGIASSNNSGQS